MAEHGPYGGPAFPSLLSFADPTAEDCYLERHGRSFAARRRVFAVLVLVSCFWASLHTVLGTIGSPVAQAFTFVGIVTATAALNKVVGDLLALDTPLLAGQSHTCGRPCPR